MSKKVIIIALIFSTIALALVFFSLPKENDLENKPKDVEIFIAKSSMELKIPKPIIKSFWWGGHLRLTLINNVKALRMYFHLIIDSYQYEIYDFWVEVLRNFEVFEYYKAFPEAFIRRLIFMPTFTGRKDLLDYEEKGSNLIVYPDYDYRSMRYRTSLVPDTINGAKGIVDFIYSLVVKALSPSYRSNKK